MKRLISAIVVGIVTTTLGLGAAQPVQAALEPTLVNKPTVPAGHIVNPDGKVVKKLPALKSERPLDKLGKVAKGKPEPRKKGQLSTLADPECVSGGCYLYNVGSQGDVSLAGVRANVVIGGHQGALSGAYDYHTLGEIAVQADNGQIVEVGWTVDPKVNKVAGTNPPVASYKPRPFVFSWINGQPTSYNGSNFVPVSGAPVTPGVTDLTPGDNVVMSIWHDDNQSVWWIYWGTGWIGYYPDAQWDNATPSVNFDRATFVQLFGEISSTEVKPRSDMGLGVVPTAANAGAGTARFSSTIFLTSGTNAAAGDTASVSLWVRPTPSATAGAPYADTMPLTPGFNQRSFYYGGPMWNAAKTGVGLKGQPTG
jgi:hypothetical protein